MEIARSVLFFFVAGVCELGGAYLIWLWLKNGRSFLFGLAGAAVLVTYGFMHTLLALLWGWQVDKVVPDRYDLIGGAVALIGVSIIMYWPRS